MRLNINYTIYSPIEKESILKKFNYYLALQRGLQHVSLDNLYMKQYSKYEIYFFFFENSI